jgi:hypothetical protein
MTTAPCESSDWAPLPGATAKERPAVWQRPPLDEPDVPEPFEEPDVEPDEELVDEPEDEEPELSEPVEASAEDPVEEPDASLDNALDEGAAAADDPLPESDDPPQPVSSRPPATVAMNRGRACWRRITNAFTQRVRNFVPAGSGWPGQSERASGVNLSGLRERRGGIVASSRGSVLPVEDHLGLPVVALGPRC